MEGEKMKLPEPKLEGSTSLEEVLSLRRSIREYREAEISVEQVSQLLWSAYGITSGEGYRTAPSAMALYPLEIDLVAGAVTDLPAGVYRYSPIDHSLKISKEGNLIQELAGTTFDQAFVGQGAAVVVFSAVYERTAAKFGDQGAKMAHLDLGHSAQNLHLQATALGIGTVVVGAFRPDEVSQLLGLPGNEEPLYLMPLGKMV